MILGCGDRQEAISLVYRVLDEAIRDSIPSSTITASCKKQKITPSVSSQSFGGPSAFHPQPVAASHQSSSGKKHKPGQVLPGVSSINQYPLSVPGGRNQVPNRVISGTAMHELAEGASLESLVGRRVRKDGLITTTFMDPLSPTTIYLMVDMVWSMIWGLQIKHGNGLICQ
ncbi:Protein EMSY-LIKE 4, partial [Mucuna pruriens]